MKLNKIALAVIAAATLPAVANAGVTVTPVILGYHWSESIEDTADKQREILKTGKNLYKNKDGKSINSKGDRVDAKYDNGGVALEDGLYTGAAIGIELTPTIALEVEYGETSVNAEASEKSAKAGVNRFDAKQKMTSGNFLIGTETFSGYTNSNFKPYILIGAGQSKIDVKAREAYTTSPGYALSNGQTEVKAGTKVANSTDTIGNLSLIHI